MRGDEEFRRCWWRESGFWCLKLHSVCGTHVQKPQVQIIQQLPLLSCSGLQNSLLLLLPGGAAFMLPACLLVIG